MYPVYPLVAIMAAYAAIGVLDLVGDAVSAMRGEAPPLLLSVDLHEMGLIEGMPFSPERTAKLAAAHEKRNRSAWGHGTKRGLLVCLLLTAASLCFGRLNAVNLHYFGFSKTWRDAAATLASDRTNAADSGDSAAAAATEREQAMVTVCTGGEWYRFASHFHLPPHARLAFVKDNFKGQLPRYYAAAADGGTAAAVSDAFNNQNAEEPSRYVDLHACDYALSSIDKTAAEPKQGPMLKKMTILYSKEARHKFIDEEMELTYFEPMAYHRVINLQRSINPLARAYAIPLYSGVHNTRMHYTLYRRVHL